MGCKRTLDWQAIKNALRLYNCMVYRCGRTTNSTAANIKWRAALHLWEMEIWIVPRRADLVLGRDSMPIRWNHPAETVDVIDAIMAVYQKSLRNGT